MGIVQLKEIIVAMFALAKAIAKASKDGIDLNDAVALMSNAEVKDAVMLAAKGIKDVPAEIKDFSFSEGLELAGLIIANVPELAEAMKK